MAAGVGGDPTTPPLLGDKSRAARAACGIKHEIAGVGRHVDASLNDLGIGLDDVLFVRHEATHHVIPKIRYRKHRKIFEVSDVTGAVARAFYSLGQKESRHPNFVGLPTALQCR